MGDAAKKLDALGALPALPASSRVRIELEAQRRGFPTPSSFKQWCRRRKVPLYRDGHLLFVRPCDVDTALRPTDELDADVAEAVARFTGVK